MTTENYLLPEALLDYSRRVGLREPGILRELREETSKFPGKNMQIPPELVTTTDWFDVDKIAHPLTALKLARARRMPMKGGDGAAEFDD